MKKIISLGVLLIILGQFSANAQLKKSIKTEIIDIGNEFQYIPQDRLTLLDQIAFRMYSAVTKSDTLSVVFIDNRELTFSELATIWFKTGLIFHDLEQHFDIIPAGEKLMQPHLNIKELEEIGFKIKNQINKKGYYKIKYGSGSWKIEKEHLDSLNLNQKNVLKIILSGGISLENGQDQVSLPFTTTENIDRDIIYLSARIHNLTQRK